MKVFHVGEEVASKGRTVFFLLVIRWWLMRWWCLVMDGHFSEMYDVAKKIGLHAQENIDIIFPLTFFAAGSWT